MIFFERENQCSGCCNECGWEEAREILEDGTILYEHCFDCKLGNECSTDRTCLECVAEK